MVKFKLNESHSKTKQDSLFDKKKKHYYLMQAHWTNNKSVSLLAKTGHMHYPTKLACLDPGQFY